MRVVRIVGVLEPGGAQLSALRLSRALAGFGIDSSLLLAGDATGAGIGVARRYGVAIEAFSPGEHRRLQWTPDDAFVDWLRPRLVGADLVHAHMFGAWWAAAAALEGIGTPLVASEHNAVTWPHGDHSAAAKAAAPRLAAFFAHGPAARAFAATLGLDPRSVHEGRSAVEGLDASPLPDLATPRLTFTGRFREDKGPDVLVEALPLLAERTGRAAPLLPRRRRADATMAAAPHPPARTGRAGPIHRLDLPPRPLRRRSGGARRPVPRGSVVTVGGRRDGSRRAGRRHRRGGTAVDVGRGPRPTRGPRGPPALAAGIAAILRGEQRTDLDGGRVYAARFQAGPVAGQYAAVYRRVIHPRQVG